MLTARIAVAGMRGLAKVVGYRDVLSVGKNVTKRMNARNVMDEIMAEIDRLTEVKSWVGTILAQGEGVAKNHLLRDLRKKIEIWIDKLEQKEKEMREGYDVG